MTVTRSITRRNGDTFTILLDEEDAPLFDSNKWHIKTSSKRKKPVYYVERYAHKSVRQSGKILLHREIAGACDDQQVDHRDRNTLNNTRQNLRACTQEQNHCNCPRYGNNSTGYIGVYRNNEKTPAYFTSIAAGGKRHHIGSSDNALYLAIRRDIKALALHGEFASLNFPGLAKLLDANSNN